MTQTPQISAHTDAVTYAAKLLKAGKLVAFPTETVYGLGADALNQAAVERIFEVKGRPNSHPLIVHIPCAAALPGMAAEIPAEAIKLSRRFWPGPLTLVLRKQASVSYAVTGGLDTVALRVPDHPVALALLEQFDGGIAAPSANRFGKVSPTEAGHVSADLGSLVDFILDGGSCSVGIESTILDFSSGRPVLLRPGSITCEMIEETLSQKVLPAQNSLVRSPGQHASHYAPRARVILASPDDAIDLVRNHLAEGKRIAIMAPLPLTACMDQVTFIPFPEALPEMARQLYANFRKADALNIEVIIAVPPESSGMGTAIADRLLRAAGKGHTFP